MTTNEAQPPTAFISYSHDSPEHQNCVLALSNRLRADGIDTILDQYLEAPPSVGWPRWMDRLIRDVDFVLIVCTETYYRRVMGDEKPGVGQGVRWEGALIYQHMYNADTTNDRFIPLLVQGGTRAYIPTPLQGTTWYQVEDEYEGLYRRLTRQPQALKPQLGSLKRMPALDRQLDFFQPWNVPFERNPVFLGRDRELQELEDALTARGIQAVSGLGGVGKSQVAVEYAWRHRRACQAVLWVNASTEQSLHASYAEIAHLLELPEREAIDHTQVRDAVVEWLGRSDRWLLILDHVDEADSLRRLVPRVRMGQVLLTSRRQEFQSLGILQPLQLRELAIPDAREFLLKRTGRDEPEAAEQLAKELGGLPLALEQAAAYIVDRQARIDAYLSSYGRRQLELLEKQLPALGEYDASVSTTWSLNFEEVERFEASADLLRLSAFLAPDAIPLEILQRGALQLPMSIVMDDAFNDPLGPDELLAPLARYSLIRRNVASNTFAIHRLTQAVLRRQMDEHEQREWAERAMLVVGAAFPWVEFKTWPLCDRLIPHAVACAGWGERWAIESAGAARLLNQAGLYLEARARYREAEPLLVRSLDIGRRTLPTNDPGLVTPLNNLALLYKAQGRTSEVEPLFQEGMKILAGQQPPDDQALSLALHNLADLYLGQRRYSEAEPLFKRALEIEERVEGPESTETASTLNSLAWLYTASGRNEEALPLYERALGIQAAHLGEDDPELAITLTNFGSLNVHLGQYDRAESLFNRALDIRERAFGPEHPHVANSLNQLGIFYERVGRVADAEAAYRRGLAILASIFGPQHELAVLVRNNLASLLRSAGRAADADALASGNGAAAV